MFTPDSNHFEIWISILTSQLLSARVNVKPKFACVCCQCFMMETWLFTYFIVQKEFCATTKLVQTAKLWAALPGHIYNFLNIFCVLHSYNFSLWVLVMVHPWINVFWWRPDELHYCWFNFSIIIIVVGTYQVHNCES